MDEIIEIILYVVGITIILVIRGLGQKKKTATPSSPSESAGETLSEWKSWFEIDEEEEESQPGATPIYKAEGSEKKFRESPKDVSGHEHEDTGEEVHEEPVPIEVKTPVMSGKEPFLKTELSEVQEEGERITETELPDNEYTYDEISASEIGDVDDVKKKTKQKYFFRSELKKAVIYSEILNRKYIRI
ncbi:MAG: hypothetical protein ACP5D1_00350 [Bacteroidales bacterium]